jgi:hypothetical protein
MHMIFGGSPTRPLRRREKHIRREVFNVDVAKPSYLKWSEVPITFDREDHPDRVPQPGSYPLVVAPLFKSKKINKVLLDGGSEINVLYASTLDDMGIPRSQLRPSTAPFHGVVPVMEALPIGQIDLPIRFGDMCNFRTETLTFEVVGFSGTYHEILGRPAYTKFMAVPNCTYLKQTIPHSRSYISAHTSATLNAFSSLRQTSGPRGSARSLGPRTRMSLSRPSERPALSSPPRTSRMRSSPTTAVRSVLG